METRGRHVIAELDGCDARLLSNPPCIRLLMRRAAEEAGATLLADEVFEFQNGGVSGFVLLAESHISIHTWPEHRYAALDIFTCGQHTLPDMACAYLMKHLGATDVRVTAMERGVPTKRGSHEHHVAPPRVGMVGPVLANLPNSA
ncbi:MAG TPA: adenosylmethionine decarboxylase [Isosphaeraceae bacterium]|jgi:S-adenosylmethionine decarboxylase|nr:adenosylmethionine decarboxylase [Isosphaeraceae bacterium]